MGLVVREDQQPVLNICARAWQRLVRATKRSQDTIRESVTSALVVREATQPPVPLTDGEDDPQLERRRWPTWWLVVGFTVTGLLAGSNKYAFHAWLLGLCLTAGVRLFRSQRRWVRRTAVGVLLFGVAIVAAAAQEPLGRDNGFTAATGLFGAAAALLSWRQFRSRRWVSMVMWGLWAVGFTGVAVTSLVSGS